MALTFTTLAHLDEGDIARITGIADDLDAFRAETCPKPFRDYRGHWERGADIDQACTGCGRPDPRRRTNPATTA